MGSSKRRNEDSRPGADAAEVKIAAIVCEPSLDAEDRMRRLSAILLKLVGNEPAQPETDSTARTEGVETE